MSETIICDASHLLLFCPLAGSLPMAMANGNFQRSYDVHNFVHNSMEEQVRCTKSEDVQMSVISLLFEQCRLLIVIDKWIQN